MLKAEGLTKKYGARTAVRDLGFSLAPGSVCGLLGPNGAGKTTVMHMLAGFLAPDRGRVLVCGLDMAEEPGACKSRIGYLPETPPLYPEMTVREYLRFAAGLRGMKNRAEERIDEVIGSMALSDYADRPIRVLSKGYRQRTGLAQAVLAEPSVLILDEPQSGLDPEQTVLMRAFIADYAKEHTVLLSTHSIAEADALCGRILILSEGELLADGSSDGLKKMYGRISLEEVFLGLLTAHRAKRAAEEDWK